MQAIITKVLPATDTKPSRIKAACERGSIIIPMEWDTETDGKRAKEALVKRFAAEDLKQYGSPVASNPWLRPTVCGTLPNGDMAHVFINS